jgi:hypothetical protein
MGSRSGLGTASWSGGGTLVPGGTSVLASLDVNDRTAFDNLDMIDKTHLLVLIAGQRQRFSIGSTRVGTRATRPSASEPTAGSVGRSPTKVGWAEFAERQHRQGDHGVL